MTLHHPVKIHHHFKGTCCLHVLLTDSITSKNNLFLVYLPTSNTVILSLYMAQGLSFKGNAHLSSDNFNSSFPFHSQTPTVYDSAQLQTLKQLFHTNIKLRGTRRRERKWQEGGENCRIISFTGFTLHTIHWGGGEMLENINKGDHVEDIARCGRIILLPFLLPYMKQFNMKCS